MKITVDLGRSTFYFDDEQFDAWVGYARGWDKFDRRLVKLMLEEALSAVSEAATAEQR